MDLNKAKRVEQLRCGPVMHSWRRISELICEEFPDEDQEMKGIQMHGQDLCLEAIITIHGFKDVLSIPVEVRDKWDT